MISSKTIGNYENRVLNSLNRYVFEKHKGSALTFIHELQLFRDYKGDSIFLQPDLAVYNGSQIIEVYEICSYSSYKLNLGAILEELLYYEKITKAKAFLAFEENDNHRLRILTVQEITDEVIRRNPTKNEPIHSLRDFYEIVRNNYTSSKQIKCFFRGHSFDFDPIPGIYRNDNYINEWKIYEEAIRKKPLEFTTDMTIFDHLVKMQHYGLPTRLLDITSNPLVALYFACEKNNKDDEKLGKKDGKVLVYKIPEVEIKYSGSPAVVNLSHLARLKPNFNFDNIEHQQYLKDIIREDKPGLDGSFFSIHTIDKVVCVLPKLNNERIVRQEGAFLLFGMGKKKDKMSTPAFECSEIVIDKDAKLSILEELNVLGVNEASLFPETDKVMQQIKRDYCNY